MRAKIERTLADIDVVLASATAADAGRTRLRGAIDTLDVLVHEEAVLAWIACTGQFLDLPVGAMDLTGRGVRRGYRAKDHQRWPRALGSRRRRTTDHGRRAVPPDHGMSLRRGGLRCSSKHRREFDVDAIGGDRSFSADWSGRHCRTGVGNARFFLRGWFGCRGCRLAGIQGAEMATISRVPVRSGRSVTPASSSRDGLRLRLRRSGCRCSRVPERLRCVHGCCRIRGGATGLPTGLVRRTSGTPTPVPR